MDAAQTIFTVISPINITTPPPVTHHVISGSFRSLSLFLLVFSPLHRTLSLVQEIDAFGPHQYLATNPRKDRVYTTSWALPPTLSSWAIEGSDSESSALWKVSHVNSVSISMYPVLLNGIQLK
jgi:carboxy-cis,cis-muconate cyclase